MDTQPSPLELKSCPAYQVNIKNDHGNDISLLVMVIIGMIVLSSLDQNKLFVSESLAPLTQLAKWYKEPTIQFLEL